VSTANLDSADLKAVEFGGLIREDVMDQIQQIDNYPFPFQDAIASDSVKNSYTEWTIDQMAAQDLDNANVDGAALTGNDAATGSRVGNHCQIPDKIVQVSSRADASDTIGRAQELAYQVMMRQRDLRQDVEGIFLSNQASVADDGNTTAGRLGALGAWLETNTSRGVGGADGGFSSGVVAAPTPGEGRGLTETLVRNIAQAAWEQGSDPTIAMSVPGVIRGLSEYMFTASARIATLQRNEQGMGPGTALGTVNVMILDFDVSLTLVANRKQATYDSADTTPVPVANLYILDPRYARQGILRGYQTEMQGKPGLSEIRQITVDLTLKVLNEAAHGVIADIDPTVAVTT